MSQPLRVFVSTTSKDLGTARREVAGVLRTLGLVAVTQEDFPPDYLAIREMLKAKIRDCKALVHVAGFYCGGEPKPPCDPQRSYTQLELDIAAELDVPAFVFLAGETFPFDKHDPETDDQKQCQLDHRKRLEARAEKYEHVADLWQLCYRVAVAPFPGLKRFADPHKPRNLPVESLGSLFKGRDEFLVTLWQTLRAKPTAAAAVVAKQAIHGLGGVGKTRLAIEFAHRFADHYAALLFMAADSEASLRRNLAALCGVLDLPERAAREEPVQVEAVVRWLATNPGWLLILDNADTPEAAKAVRAILPQLQGGHVLITSRRSDWKGSGIEPLPLDVL